MIRLNTTKEDMPGITYAMLPWSQLKFCNKVKVHYTYTHKSLSFALTHFKTINLLKEQFSQNLKFDIIIHSQVI